MEWTPAQAYVADWELTDAERGLETFAGFLAGAGVKFEPSDKLKKSLESLRTVKPSANFSPRATFEAQLLQAANTVLQTAGDARRLFIEGAPPRRWLLLSPDELQRAKDSGVALENPGAPFRRAMWSLASVPLVFVAYVVADRQLRAHGVDSALAIVIALAVWFALRQLTNFAVRRVR